MVKRLFSDAYPRDRSWTVQSDPPISRSTSETVVKDDETLGDTLMLLEERIRAQNDDVLRNLNGVDVDESLESRTDDLRNSLAFAQRWVETIGAFSFPQLQEACVRWKYMSDCLDQLASDLAIEKEESLGSSPDCYLVDDEKELPEMVGYVDRVRLSAQNSAAKETPASDEFVILPTSGTHENTFIFLHGFKMEAKEMLDVFVELAKTLSTWRFVLPQAPCISISAHDGSESFSWFDYLTDRGGSQEDTVDIFGLRKMKVELQRLVTVENSLLPAGTLAIIGGLSQGGTMALHLATQLDLKAVVTAVACRLSHSMSRPLKCPWYAVIASEDDVFPSSWSKALMTGVSEVKTIDDNHYLEKTDIAPVLLEILSKL
jgi:phospholipase/carboxylesterase